MKLNRRLKIVLFSGIVVIFSTFSVADEAAQLSSIDANEAKLLDLFAAENAKAKEKKEAKEKKKKEEQKK
jgi:hypothetical protein